MPKRKTCAGCGEPINPHEIRIVIPEDCDVDVASYGDFHRDCGILHEMGEDGILFKDNVERLFKMVAYCLNNFEPIEGVEDSLWAFAQEHWAVVKQVAQTRFDVENNGISLAPEPGEEAPMN
jgi:hypothetical protein